jgi:hypothetical protein
MPFWYGRKPAALTVPFGRSAASVNQVVRIDRLLGLSYCSQAQTDLCPRNRNLARRESWPLRELPRDVRTLKRSLMIGDGA